MIILTILVWFIPIWWRAVSHAADGIDDIPAARNPEWLGAIFLCVSLYWHWRAVNVQVNLIDSTCKSLMLGWNQHNVYQDTTIVLLFQTWRSESTGYFESVPPIYIKSVKILAALIIWVRLGWIDLEDGTARNTGWKDNSPYLCYNLGKPIKRLYKYTHWSSSPSIDRYGTCRFVFPFGAWVSISAMVRPWNTIKPNPLITNQNPSDYTRYRRPPLQKPRETPLLL